MNDDGTRILGALLFLVVVLAFVGILQFTCSPAAEGQTRDFGREWINHDFTTRIRDRACRGRGAPVCSLDVVDTVVFTVRQIIYKRDLVIERHWSEPLSKRPAIVCYPCDTDSVVTDTSRGRRGR